MYNLSIINPGGIFYSEQQRRNPSHGVSSLLLFHFNIQFSFSACYFALTL